MKIYTKRGDKGETSLMGGKRVAKDSLRIEAYGAVDELNSLIGVVLSEGVDKRAYKKLERVQIELFVLGGDLATSKDMKIKVPRVNKTFIKRLEKEIDEWEKELPAIKNFILPGGTSAGANLHLARTIARRAERLITKLSAEERINENAPAYINRLSDWLFVLARYVNKAEGQEESVWLGRKAK